MRKPDPIRRRRGAAAVTFTVAATALAATALVVSLAAVGSAFAADEEEEVPLDTKILRQVMKDWGLRRTDEPDIEYRERPPLVLPPSRNLPKPQEETAATNSPAWPKERGHRPSDVAQRARLQAPVQSAVLELQSEQVG